jgi:excisionase family DNA binding protein
MKVKRQGLTPEQASNPHVQDVQLLSVAQVARQLGISATLVYRMVERGDLPVIRFGRAIRFMPAEVHAWLASRQERAG